MSPFYSIPPTLFCFATGLIHWTPPQVHTLSDLDRFLVPFQTKLELPALAAVVVHDKRIVAAGAVGERKFQSGITVTLADKFHIGSCTKSMTALLAADLVREGEISFSTRVGDVFSDWDLTAEKSGITLEILLQNRSGITGHPDAALWARAFKLKGTPPEQRREFLRAVLAAPLEAASGTKYLYSNLGFALAGAMLEEMTGKPWEQLMTNRIFGPLGLTSAGFGAPSGEKVVDQPWGHQRIDGAIVPIPPTDNPVSIAPAALVHLSILDLARYAAFHRDCFNGRIREFASLKDRLYTPPAGSDYAGGWIVQKRDWAGGTVLTHAGSNTMFYAVIWIAPLKEKAFVVATNIGDKDGAEAATAKKRDEVVAALIKEF